MSGRFTIERDMERARTPPQLASTVAPEPGPIGPELLYLSNTQLWLHDTFRTSRRWLCLGTAFLAMLPLALWIWNWTIGKAEQEAQMLQLLEDELSAFGETYINNQIDGGDRVLPLIWPDRELSFAEYVRYKIVLSPGGWRAHLVLALFVLTAIFAGLWGLWYLLRQPRNGPLIFDHARQAVYIQHGKNVLLAPWDQVSFVNRAWEFGWYLFDATGQQKVILINLPKDALGALSRPEGERLLKRIAAFMAGGADTIETSMSCSASSREPSEKLLMEVDRRLQAYREGMSR